ncbi:MAG: signal peptidase I [Candidatus Moraniibacteriota bacterium]|nr:MAG: signal peptidase I [Candidatus Moranbacteria bacterium]
METRKFRDSPLPASEEEMVGVKGFLWELLKIALLAFVIIIPVRVFLFQPFFVQGSSMEPNFHDGEYLLIREFGYKETSLALGAKEIFRVRPSRELERGDPVVFRPPGITGQYFIKRVIGLPGETVEVVGSRVRVRNKENPDGFFVDERQYLLPSVKTLGEKSFTLTENEYFVLGDNRTASRDSRSFGPVSKDRVTGKVLLRAWPLDRWKIF